MSHHRTHRLAALAASAVVVLGLGVAAAAPSTADDTTPGRLLLMLDASGSMKKPDPSGLTKIEAAKKALTSVVGALPDDSTVGLRVYGATVDSDGKPTKAACADTQLAVPVGPLDRPAMTAAVAGFRAVGETPIAASLTKALADLGPTGKRNIVLVSDGEESCVPDPCPTVRKLVADGVDLQIDTVGFAVSGKAREQLQCIADAGRGTYYDAKDADALATSLGKLSQRALRSFTVDGTPVKATADAASAPLLRPGRYTDHLSAGAPPRFLRLARTPGSVVHLSLVARPLATGRKSTDAEQWTVVLSTPDGTQCVRESQSDIEFFRAGSVQTVSAAANNRNAAEEQPDADDPCATSRELVASLEHPKGAGTVPVQLLYLEEPPVTNLAVLPDGLEPEAVEGAAAEPSGTPAPVVGGGSFSDAPELTPGTWTDTILPGEQLYYRVRLDFGQRAAITARITAGGDSDQYSLYTMNLWTPALYEVSRSGGNPDNRVSRLPGTRTVAVTEFVPEVRYRNKTSMGNGYHYPALQQESLPGSYYVALGRGEPKAGTAGNELPVEISVAVEGTPTGVPAYAQVAGTASPTPSASPSPSSTSGSGPTGDDDGSPWPMVAGGGAVALLGAGGVLLALRRGRGGDQPAGGSQA